MSEEWGRPSPKRQRQEDTKDSDPSDPRGRMSNHHGPSQVQDEAQRAAACVLDGAIWVAGGRTVTGGGTASGGAAFALNFLGRTALNADSSKVVKAEVVNSALRSTGAVQVKALSTSTIESIALGANTSRRQAQRIDADPQLHRGRHLVDVLPARSRRRDEAFAERAQRPLHRGFSGLVSHR